MNDKELDEMLNQWDAPAVRTELRENVRAGFVAAKTKPRRRFAWPSWHVGKGLFAGLAAAALCLVAISQAFPQALNLSSSSPVAFPYVVISSVVAYADDGSSRPDANIISSSYKGTEIVISETHPGNPWQEWIKGFHNSVHYFLLRYVPGLVLPESAAKDAWFNSYVQSGCVGSGQTPVGHDTILGHATTALQHIDPDGWRGTEWRAPDLGCFALRRKSEAPDPGGGYRLVAERDAQKVLQRGGSPWH
jgi:hypothetical protein